MAAGKELGQDVIHQGGGCVRMFSQQALEGHLRPAACFRDEQFSCQGGGLPGPFMDQLQQGWHLLLILIHPGDLAIIALDLPGELIAKPAGI